MSGITDHAYYKLCDLVLNDKSLRDEVALEQYLNAHGIDYQKQHVEAALLWVKAFEPKQFECYQCEKVVPYLFADSRCSSCTRLSIEDITGGD